MERLLMTHDATVQEVLTALDHAVLADRLLYPRQAGTLRTMFTLEPRR